MNPFDPYADYIRQEKKWTDLGFTPFLERTLEDPNSSGSIPSDVLSAMIERGSLNGAQIFSLGAEAIVDGLFTNQITAGVENEVAALSGKDPTYRIWAGHANPASAPFSVDKDGNLVASSASFGQYISKAGTGQTVTGDFQLGVSNVKIDGANKRILINDGTFDRVLIGFQSSGF